MLQSPVHPVHSHRGIMGAGADTSAGCASPEQQQELFTASATGAGASATGTVQEQQDPATVPVSGIGFDTTRVGSVQEQQDPPVAGDTDAGFSFRTGSWLPGAGMFTSETAGVPVSAGLLHFSSRRAFRITKTALASLRSRPVTRPRYPSRAATTMNATLINDTAMFCRIMDTVRCETPGRTRSFRGHRTSGRRPRPRSRCPCPPHPWQCRHPQRPWPVRR